MCQCLHIFTHLHILLSINFFKTWVHDATNISEHITHISITSQSIRFTYFVFTIVFQTLPTLFLLGGWGTLSFHLHFQDPCHALVLGDGPDALSLRNTLDFGHGDGPEHPAQLGVVVPSCNNAVVELSCAQRRFVLNQAGTLAMLVGKGFMVNFSIEIRIRNDSRSWIRNDQNVAFESLGLHEVWNDSYGSSLSSLSHPQFQMLDVIRLIQRDDYCSLQCLTPGCLLQLLRFQVNVGS